MIREAQKAPSAASWFSAFRVFVLFALVFLAGTVAYIWLGPKQKETEEPPKEEQAAVVVHDSLFKRT